MSSAILLSGGVDSSCLAFWLRPAHAFTVDYGQVTAKREISTSASLCKDLGIDHSTITADCSPLGRGSLSGEPTQGTGEVLDEWWPYRNQLLLTLCAMRAHSLNVETLMIGCVKTDTHFSDGSRDFIEKMNLLFGCQLSGLRVIAPGIDMTTDDLIHASAMPQDLLYRTHSCNVSDLPCGQCNSCAKRNEILRSIGGV